MATLTASSATPGGGEGASARRRPPARRRAAGRAPAAAARLPVAQVAVDVPLAHLDRPFDYLVPAAMADTAVPGCRVRVRFAGQLTGGYLLARDERSEHTGRLAFLERVVSPEPVLSAEVAALARDVADRYAGTLADVLRLAVPPRHAGAERAGGAAALPPPPAPEPGPWARYPAGPSFLRALAQGRAPRAVWSALPGADWPEEVARAAGTAASAGRGVVAVVPDTRDLALVDAALARVLGEGQHVCLSAGLGPAERYRRWLAAARGTVRVAAGTRAAMFAPVHDLGLVIVWDDGDDLHAEPRAPYPHAREVLALRAHRAGAAALIGGFTRTVAATSLVERKWAVPVTAERAVIRQHAAQVRASGDDAELARDEAARSARLPSLALRTAREGLTRGPVLVQVPRRGYLRAVACGGCRASARCVACGGPLAVDGPDAPARCQWCGRHDAGWRCPECGGTRVRVVVAGARRTAEELGRAFPGAQVLTSGGATVLADVAAEPAVVVATPGAEPVAARGYAAAVLLDGWALLSRPSLDAAQETLRRWMNAAALVVPAGAGGRVVVVADAGLAPVQALVRWDAVTCAERELAERTTLGFPPAVRMAAVTGVPEAVDDLLSATPLPGAAQLLGPVPAEDDGLVRVLVRVPRNQAAALATALKTGQAHRSARKAGGQVRVRIDPAAPA